MMNEKIDWKSFTIGFTCGLIITIIIATIVCICGQGQIYESMNVNDTESYASIIEKSEGFSSMINMFLNETGMALSNYYNTSNITYLIHASQHILLARSSYQDYLSWYLRIPKIEIDDDLDAYIYIKHDIYNDIFNLENRIFYYKVDVYIAHRSSV